MLIQKRTALIVVAHIVFFRPFRECDLRMPYVMSMVFTNKFGRVFAIFDSNF